MSKNKGSNTPTEEVKETEINRKRATFTPESDMFIEDNQYLDDDDDLVGTSPINLPDPSLFSDYHENDIGANGDYVPGDS
jgi:hypothetical protein